jgi:hypothetical protein
VGRSGDPAPRGVMSVARRGAGAKGDGLGAGGGGFCAPSEFIEAEGRRGGECGASWSPAGKRLNRIAYQYQTFAPLLGASWGGGFYGVGPSGTRAVGAPAASARVHRRREYAAPDLPPLHRGSGDSGHEAQLGMYRAFLREVPTASSGLIRPASWVAPMTWETIALLDSPSPKRPRSD